MPDKRPCQLLHGVCCQSAQQQHCHEENEDNAHLKGPLWSYSNQHDGIGTLLSKQKDRGTLRPHIACNAASHAEQIACGWQSDRDHGSTAFLLTPRKLAKMPIRLLSKLPADRMASAHTKS